MDPLSLRVIFEEQVVAAFRCPICLDRVNDPRLFRCGHLYCNRCIEQAPQPNRCVFHPDQDEPLPLFVDFFDLVDGILQRLTEEDQRIAQRDERIDRLYQNYNELQRRVYILRREVHLLRGGQFYGPFDRLWVAGSRFDGVNGEYELNRMVNHSPCYTRRGTWERGAQVTFTIYRRPLTRRPGLGDAGIWQLSIIPLNGELFECYCFLFTI